ncbi:hypothetical protein GR217_09975 [Rhizobium leguminosarum]|uniref:VOC domain-containing protein n=1 Tax=Rhizobium ruizarguesonis TaxID=2081791 RepID=A0AAE4YQ01_9HYPH|nr:VOC family protein [Rhizobium ruizarguesonis]NEI48018.1 hypothetical protein [Rhizobium ruizarguesonis]
MFRLPLSALFQLSSVELFEYSGEEDSRPKRLSEVGGMHLCFEVDDVHACAERLRAQGVDMLDGPNLVESGPLRGFNWIYFRSPWGLMLEAAASTGLVTKAIRRIDCGVPSQRENTAPDIRPHIESGASDESEECLPLS